MRAEKNVKFCYRQYRQIFVRVERFSVNIDVEFRTLLWHLYVNELGLSPN